MSMRFPNLFWSRANGFQGEDSWEMAHIKMWNSFLHLAPSRIAQVPITLEAPSRLDNPHPPLSSTCLAWPSSHLHKMFIHLQWWNLFRSQSPVDLFSSKLFDGDTKASNELYLGCSLRKS